MCNQLKKSRILRYQKTSSSHHKLFKKKLFWPLHIDQAGKIGP